MAYRQNAPLSIGVDVTVDVKSGTNWRTSLSYLIESDNRYNTLGLKIAIEHKKAFQMTNDKRLMYQKPMYPQE